MFTDTHCHLFKEYYEDLSLVINNANKVGVNKFISASDSINSSKEMLELAGKFDGVYVSIGIHPENTNDDINELEELIKNNKDNIIAIGEIGLDYHYGKENKEKQIELFKKELELAKIYDLPVVIHSRDATLDTLNILKEYKVRGVLHCFSGSLETAKEYIKLGMFIGVDGPLTFKNSKLKEVIKELPLENILLETDSPYLAPDPLRGTVNEPKNIPIIASFLADIKGVSIEEVSKVTEDNVSRLYHI